MESPGQNTGVDSPSLLQEIFPTQGLNPSLPHFRRILYQLSHQGSPFSYNSPLEAPLEVSSSSQKLISLNQCFFYIIWL